jgi:tRNA pseudouridine55 synthase
MASVTTGGLLIVDKPDGWTSHDVVGRVRRIAGTRRVGHAGTLDPMATGVLLVGVERATKLLGHLSGAGKSYDATVRLGESTTTDDAEGERVSTASTAAVDDAAVRSAFARYTGEFDQVPSAVSAVKIAGRRAYQRVRDGETVDIPPRRVVVSRLDVQVIRRPSPDQIDVDIAVDCSTGTYIRALARDAGAALGVGGHLTALRRTRVASFGLDRALSLEEIAERPDPVMIGLDDLVAEVFGRHDVDADQARAAANGVRLPARGTAEPYGVFGPDGRVISVVQEHDGAARPLVVLRPANG